MPDLPAVAEQLPGFELVGWYGIIGPPGLLAATGQGLPVQARATVPRIARWPMGTVDVGHRISVGSSD